jgi:hypothetical protein
MQHHGVLQRQLPGETWWLEVEGPRVRAALLSALDVDRSLGVILYSSLQCSTLQAAMLLARVVCAQPLKVATLNFAFYVQALDWREGHKQACTGQVLMQGRHPSLNRQPTPLPC